MEGPKGSWLQSDKCLVYPHRILERNGIRGECGSRLRVQENKATTRIARVWAAIRQRPINKQKSRVSKQISEGRTR